MPVTGGAHEQIESILGRMGLTYDWPGLGHALAGASVMGGVIFGAAELSGSAFGPLASRTSAPAA